MKQLDLAVQQSNYGIDAPVIIDVAEGDAPMRPGHKKIGSGAIAHFLEASVAEVSKDRVSFEVSLAGNRFLDVVHHIGTRNEQVLLAVVVEIEDAVSPARHAIGEPAEPRG